MGGAATLPSHLLGELPENELHVTDHGVFGADFGVEITRIARAMNDGLARRNGRCGERLGEAGAYAEYDVGRF